ncbi:MAG: acyl-CoA dehydrogenase [Pseudomonadota bacterium]
MHLVLEDRQEALLAQGRALGDSLPRDHDAGLADAALDAARGEGLALLTVPSDRGGAGLTLFDACLLLEGLAGRRPSAAATLAAHALLAGAPMARCQGGEEPLAALAAGRVGALALAEPGGDSRLTNFGTQAGVHGDGYRISGEKVCVTNGGARALVLVAARVDGEEDPALFVVDGDAEGIEWRPRRCNIGLFGTRIADLTLHATPPMARLGGVGEGAGIIETILLQERTAVAAQAIGVASGALRDTLRAVSTREISRKPMQRNGTVQALVADMAAALDGGRLLWWQAASALDKGAPARDLTAMAKLHAARAARQVTDGCLQLLGDDGCFDDPTAAHRAGAARLASLRGGSDEHLRAVAAREFLARLEVMGMIT